MRFFRRRAADTTQAAGLWAPGERADIRGRLERILQENIVPFWARVADYEHGGYRHNHDGAGNDLGPAPKRAIAGARTAWFFAAMERSPYGEAEHARLAAHGLASLREQLWDPLNGGVFWEVDATGRKATRAEKHPVAQAFALYAAAELALSGHDGAAELADSLFDLLESRAHDPQNGGYFESFGADWRPLGSGRNLLGHPPGVKTVDTHLHLLEALTPYAKLGHRQIARDRLYELVLILMRTVVRRDHPSARAGSSDAWQALGGRPDKQAAHGHDIEMVWLVADAMDALGQSQTPLRDTYQAIADHVIACAFDQERGGFYERGNAGRRVRDRRKVWWVQAEALVAMLWLALLTGERRYHSAFDRTLTWIEQSQADWEHGDWHANVLADGSVHGGKASGWKTPYHNGRAMLRCLELLRESES